MTSLPNPLSGKNISLPIIGTISLTAAIGGGILLYFLLFRRRGVSSKTTTVRFRK